MWERARAMELGPMEPIQERLWNFMATVDVDSMILTLLNDPDAVTFISLSLSSS